MEIYLVRHGETGGNVAHRHQAEETPLSYIGVNQAKEVAKVLKKYQPTHLLSSSLVRAVETARVIGEECGMDPEISGKFAELERPSFLYGRKHRSAASLQFYARWYFGFTKDSEGETYTELRARIEEAKQHLSQYPADARVVVVTHSVFMNLFIEHICREKPITPLMAASTFRRILKIQNTHVEPLQFHGLLNSGECPWTLHK